jgi:uncharacterized protein (TIGR03067 family)
MIVPPRRQPVMSAFRLLLVLATAALIGFAPAPFPKKKRAQTVDDLGALQGTWKVVVYEHNRTPMTSAYQVEIDKDQWKFVRPTNGVMTTTATYQLRLHPKAAPPAFDWKGLGATSLSLVGSYRLEGKRLTIIFGYTGSPRPTDFTGGTGYRMILERR